MGGSPEELGPRCHGYASSCYAGYSFSVMLTQVVPSGAAIFSGVPVGALSAVSSLASQEVIQLSEGLICPHSACQGLNLTMGYPDIWLNVILGVSVKGVLGEINI